LSCIILFLLGGADGSLGDDTKLPTLRVVFFTPRDVTPPQNVGTRLTQVARYTEDFYVRWMTHWGYEPARKQMFQWQPDGSVEVLFARGEKSADEYPDGSFRPQMTQKLIREHNIPQNGNIWWIFVYLGDPPARFKNFKGAGDSNSSGWAILNYDSSPGQIRLKTDLAEGFNHEFSLKGAMHELGHAFGLQHLGPRIHRDLGNSLMGPVNRIYWRHLGPNEKRGYMTEASAAMLWKHPLFSGTTTDRLAKPRSVKLEDYQSRFDREGERVEIRGRLVSDRPAHSVIVVDDMDEKPGEYWKRAYVDRINEDGTFHVVIDEPVPCHGTHRIIFCFDNGMVTGNGRQLAFRGAIEKPYRYTGRGYRFE
jgi:hypothetical protein